MTEQNLPHDEELEKTIIGVILNDPDRYAQVAGTLRPEHFFKPRTREIYRAIEAVADREDRPSFLAVSSWMVEKDIDIDDSYLSRVTDLSHVFGGADMVDLEARADTLVELYSRRGLMQEYQASWSRLQSGDDAEEVAGDVEQKTDSLLDDGPDDDYSIVDYCKDHEALVDGERDKYFDTGMGVIDDVLGGGVALNRFYLLSALSGHGKSRLATAIAAKLLGRHDNFHVDWWYVDGHKRDVYQQLVAHCGPVHSMYLDRPHDVPDNLHHELETNKMEGAGAVKGWEDEGRLRVFAEGEPDLRRIKMTSQRRAAQVDGPYLLVVDYIQRVDAGFDGERSDYKNVRRTSRTLNDLKSLDNTSVLGLGQFNRSAGKGEGMPSLRQMRGASQLEDDANHALIWHRSGQQQAEGGDDPPDELELRCGVLNHAKSKHTRTGARTVYCDLARCMFQRWSPSVAQEAIRQDREDGLLTEGGAQ